MVLAAVGSDKCVTRIYGLWHVVWQKADCPESRLIKEGSFVAGVRIFLSHDGFLAGGGWERKENLAEGQNGGGLGY